MLSLFKKQNNNELIKSNLLVQQTKSNLMIAGTVKGNNISVTELWLISRKEHHRIKVSENTSPSANFSFDISLNKLLHLLQNHEEQTFDWYIKVRQPLSTTKPQVNTNDNENKYSEEFIRCGKFQKTKITGLDFYVENENSLINYVTIKGNLSVIVNSDVKAPIATQIERIKSKKNLFRIEGKLFTRNAKILEGEIFLQGRESNDIIQSSNVQFQHLTKETESTFGLNRYHYVAVVELADDDHVLLQEDIYDFYFRLKLHDQFEERIVRIGRPTFRVRYFLKNLYLQTHKDAVVINPYFTFKYNNLSLEVYKYPIETFQYLRKVMRWSWLIRLRNIHKNVWLVGERTYKAQDTGYAFFRYMRTKHPNMDVYYVIEKDSPEKRNVEPLGNVLEFKSKEHIYKTLIAKKVISSHHPDYLYPLRTNTFKKKVKAVKVFLQHGVMGTKNMVANYGKNANGFEVDLFMVSSDFEKKIIVEDFGYSPKEVFVTGLSRFDTLFENDIEKKRQILIIPTWRDWITTDEAFLESEYYERYNELIHHQKLHELAKTFNFDIVFCLHPNMQRFTNYFENSNVTIINQGEVNVQDLIKESSLMITDYSSVGFDFSFLYKPVLYYQFDRARFIGKRPSHLNLDEDLPGDICFQVEELLELVEYYAKENFKMKPEYKKRADKFIKYRDQSSCERIYNVIRNTKVRKKLFALTKLKMIAEALYRRYRKSRYYFPSMKLFYQIASKLIPVDDKLILFESGIGKQYGDSPKNIYEEIVRQNLDFKKVWVHNKPIRFNDNQTIRIERLSPKYFYYLARAKYWVNNQNFPTYIKKRPQTIYLQTWHGTPLKKMLYDLKEVHGRSDDYVERVGNAVKNWDYLISPSPYATKAFKSAFRFNKKILEVGYPRNDIFYKEERHQLAKTVKNKLHIPKNKKVILYAPTFRDNQTVKNNKFYFDINMDMHKMKEKLGEDYVLLLRMHVIVNNKIEIDETLQNFVYDVSNYPDIQELLLITDILITDYSSVMFDFANTEKPMLFYTYDLKTYRDKLRGFYMDFENEAPGPLVFDTDEIIQCIENIEEIKINYKDKYKQFKQKYCPLDDGYASQRVVEAIFK